MEADWCWRAEERRQGGHTAPEDKRQCLSPCPTLTDRARGVLDLVELARMQLRAGGFGFYGLDWNVIARLADDAGIETTTEWWELLATVDATYLSILNPPKEPGPVEG